MDAGEDQIMTGRSLYQDFIRIAHARFPDPISKHYQVLAMSGEIDGATRLNLFLPIYLYARRDYLSYRKYQP
jgi:hypothetical protein